MGIPAESDRYLIGSCKYKNEKIEVDEIELIKQYANVYKPGAKFDYCIFSKGGFTEELQKTAARENVRLFTLEDIYR